MRMRVVVDQPDVIKLEIENRMNIRIQAQDGQWIWIARKLQIHLPHMIDVQMRITQTMHELAGFETGDYVGIYSKTEGLDVSHTGIIIKQGSLVYMRHASSVKKHMKVLDEELMEYLKARPGLIVLRPGD